MDPKLLAKAKARRAGVKGPPPLPTVDQDRPTPRPPALDPDRPTPRPPPLGDPLPPTPRVPSVDAGPPTARPVPVPLNAQTTDEDEHTVMRPAAAPLPRDAFRDDASSSSAAVAGEPSVGLPLELTVQEPSLRRSRTSMVWALLAAVALGAGVLLLLLRSESDPALSNGTAPEAAPKSFTRPPPPPSPSRPRDDATLDPPIATSFESNESLPEEEAGSPPTAVRRPRRPRPAPPPRPAQPAAAAPGTTAPSAAAAAPGTTAPSAAAEPGTTAAPSPAAAPGTTDGEKEPASAAEGEPTPIEEVAAGEELPSPAEAAAPSAGGAPATPPGAVPSGNVDRENPYAR